MSYNNGIYEVLSEDVGHFSVGATSFNVALCRFPQDENQGIDIVVKRDQRRFEPVPQAASQINFLKCDQLPSSLNFSRDSQASYFNAAGELRWARSDQPRCDHDPLTGDVKGLLLEPTSENILLQSKSLDKTPWGGVIEISQEGVAPDGSTAWLLRDRSKSSKEVLTSWKTNSVPNDNSTYTFSFYAKKSDAEVFSFNLGFFGGTNRACYQFVKWTDQDPIWTKGSTGTLNRGFRSVGKGWYRFWVTCANNSKGNTTLRAILSPVGDEDNNGDDTGATYFWGPQVELGWAPTSYIQTQESPMARQSDHLSFATSIANSETTVFTQWSPRLPTNSSGGELFKVTDSRGESIGLNGESSSGLRTAIFRDSSIQNLSQSNGRGEIWRDNHSLQAALSVSSNEAISYQNGREASRYSLASVNFTEFSEISIGAQLRSVAHGHLQNLKFWPNALSVDQLTTLTFPGEPPQTNYAATIRKGQRFDDEDGETIHLRTESATIATQSLQSGAEIHFKSEQFYFNLDLNHDQKSQPQLVDANVEMIINGQSFKKTGACFFEPENFR